MRPDTSRRRALVVAGFLCAWMMIAGARLVYLQTAEHDWLSRRARAQQTGSEAVSPVRGLIVDRQGRELARSVDCDSYFAVPTEIENIDDAAKHLAVALKMDATALASRLKDAKNAHRGFIWLARKLEVEQSKAVSDLKLKGVYAQQEPKRRYPNGDSAAHVLGYVGLDDKGLGGVEQFYNASLTGETGKLTFEGDARRHAYESVGVTPRPGQSLVLTIDQTIQYMAEQSLAAQVERTHAKSGTAIVLDPHTGEILALANAPAFDPNDAGQASAESRRNDALQNIYEPGSTFKAVAYSGVLEEGLGQPDDRVDCQMGSITVAGRVIHDHSPYGTLTLTEALAKSSNVAAIKMGLRLGDARMYDYIRRFGFGARTGVELPGETSGLVRPVERWQASSIGSIAMGQEIGVTPLQVAGAYGALANEGVRVAPHIVREVRDENGAVVQATQAESHRVVSAETARKIREMLKSVTTDGTAKAAQLEGYSAAGKTGTAQKIDPKTRKYSATKYVASFVGFAPVENPSVVIIVVVDEPVGGHHGGDIAAPVFAEIANQVLPYLNVAPDQDLKTPAPATERLLAQAARVAAEAKAARESAPDESDGVRAPEVARRASDGGEIIYATAGGRALMMPDLRGRSVRDAARICAQLGLELEAHGEGLAVRQSPSIGASVEAGQVVRIDFGKSD